jgi:hypothetical protein
MIAYRHAVVTRKNGEMHQLMVRHLEPAYPESSDMPKPEGRVPNTIDNRKSNDGNELCDHVDAFAKKPGLCGGFRRSASPSAVE